MQNSFQYAIGVCPTYCRCCGGLKHDAAELQPESSEAALTIFWHVSKVEPLQSMLINVL